MESRIRLSGLLDGFRHIVDTIWIISIDDAQVEILRDSMMPEEEGQVLDYKVLSDTYISDYVYPPDVDLWNEALSFPALKAFSVSGLCEKRLDMRFSNTLFGFEWHEAFVRVLNDDTGKKHILLTSRYVNAVRKASIVEKAVETEYDYVVYIEANKNSYVMYTSNHESGTPVPPVASDDYERELAAFHRRYVPESQRDELTRDLSIANVRSRLREKGEYVVYCTVIEHGRYRNKKLRFSYFDRKQDIWLLTRTDVTEVYEEKRQKKLLQDALDAATVANRAKSEFLSRMSHDIRTPMNAIIGMTAIARAHAEHPERIADCLEKIAMSSRLLLGLINEVLDMSKIESGSIVLSQEEVNLTDLLEGVLTMLQPSIENKGLHFEVHLNDVRNESVIGDTQRLQQMLMNLLSNAVKYTPKQGRIVFDVTEKPSQERGFGRYEFVIADTGIGMKPDFLKKLFEPFERADDEAIRSIQGTGLGMAITQNIVTIMGGDIHVESEYGRGSTFTVSVPLRLQPQASSDTKGLEGLPVLVVDDDELTCRNTCRRLEEIGMDGEWTLSGREAVHRVVEAHETGSDYFAVIIDLKMPDMDGIETTRRIRAQVGPDIPIIMISAYDWSRYEEEALRAGVNGFIMKPLFRSRLTCKLTQFLDKKPLEHRGSFPVRDNLQGRRILLVEDNALNREIAVELLSWTGVTVETAENGKIAVEKIRSASEGYFHLVFMDIQMPVMDGSEAASAIRALDREDVRTLPIIALTANAFSNDREKAQQCGMNEHLPKPIDLDSLNETLNRWLAGGRTTATT